MCRPPVSDMGKAHEAGFLFASFLIRDYDVIRSSYPYEGCSFSSCIMQCMQLILDNNWDYDKYGTRFSLLVSASETQYVHTDPAPGGLPNPESRLCGLLGQRWASGMALTT
jgi:hypothetical protein